MAAAQLAGRVVTVLDGEWSAGAIEQLLATVEVATVSCARHRLGDAPPGRPRIDHDDLLDAVDHWLATGGEPPPGAEAADDDLGFAPGTGPSAIMFSSGTTGEPKGVIHSHETLAIGFTESEVAGLFDPPGCWVNGAPLGYVGSHLILHLCWRARFPIALFDLGADGLAALVPFIVRVGATCFSTQTSVLRSLLEVPEAPTLPLRGMTIFGEPMPETMLRRWKERMPQTVLRVGYGSSESVVAAWRILRSHEPVPDDLSTLHVPEHAVLMDVVDEDGRSVGVGEVGELLVHNRVLSLGYLGRDDLTEHAFPLIDGRRWFRTSDAVRRKGPNSFEFVGRLDHRVKVLGHLVDPGEIERVLGLHPAVSQAVVVTVPRATGGNRLHAYIVRSVAIDVGRGELRRHVASHLPAQCVPSTWSIVDSLPAGSTAKADRRLLAQRAALVPFETDPSRTPTTPEEAAIHAEVSRLLALDELGIDDDLLDLGADSLALAELEVRLRDVLDRPPPLEAIVSAPTIRGIAAAAAAGATTGLLVPLAGEAEGAAVTVVLLPGAGAAVAYLRPLARLLVHRLAVQGRPARVVGVATSRVADASDALDAAVTELRALPGPLVLVGHSWAGPSPRPSRRGSRVPARTSAMWSASTRSHPRRSAGSAACGPRCAMAGVRRAWQPTRMRRPARSCRRSATSATVSTSRPAPPCDGCPRRCRGRSWWPPRRRSPSTWRPGRRSCPPAWTSSKRPAVTCR